MVETNEQPANDEFNEIIRMIGTMTPDNESRIVGYMRTNQHRILDLAHSLADEFPNESLRVADVLGRLLEIMASE